MSEFEALLAQLTAAQEEQTTLAKALPAEGGKDDKTIQTAAADGAAGAKPNPEDDEPELDADGKPLVKSLVEGQEFEVVDAEALIKSLTDLTTRADAADSILAKGMAGLLDLVKGQNEMFKSMQAQITKLSGQGAGRKTLLSVLEKPVVGEPLAKSLAEPTITKADILAKASAAFDAHKITGHEFTTVDVSLRQGVMPDQAILAKCF